MMIAYFGYGTNRDQDMMMAMIGRNDIKGERGVLKGYELVIQNLEDISDKIVEGAPFHSSPQEIMKSALGESAKLYIIRPNPSAETYGTIWQITEDEYEMVRDWELIDFGMQEDLELKVENMSGMDIQTKTHGSSNPALQASQIIVGADYEDYIVPKEVIIKTAKRVHKEFLERQLG